MDSVFDYSAGATQADDMTIVCARVCAEWATTVAK